MRRSNILAAQFAAQTGQELSLTNTGTLTFTIAMPLPGGGVQTWGSRWNPDGSMTFLGQSAGPGYIAI